MGTWAALAGDSSCGGQARRTPKKGKCACSREHVLKGNAFGDDIFNAEWTPRALGTSSDLHGLRVEGGMGANLEEKNAKDHSNPNIS